MELESDISKTKMINNLEKRKEIIKTLTDTMHNNKQFNKLLIYSLNSLKSYLIVNNPIQAVENALIMLNSKIIL